MDADAKKTVLRMIPYGLYVLTSEGDPVGTGTINWVSQMSFDPPLIAMGVKKDTTRAADFFRKGCDLGQMRGCSTLGALHANGDGVVKDAALAKRLFERSCSGGFDGACQNLKTMEAVYSTEVAEE